jgi:glutathione synthase/RimK-type ligase-like ATP-grasp enzyme
MSIYIYPYKQGSKSVALLSEELGAKVIRLENSKFKGSENKVVINWGNSMNNEELDKAMVLNKPANVAIASNKLSFFEAVKENVSIPPFTTDKSIADVWIAEGKKVVVREKLNGHSGEGIILIENTDSWEQYNHDRSKLYVMYIPKKDEYRVHVVNGEIVDLQRKAIHPDMNRERVNYSIRNRGNGFIFVREGVKESCPEDVVNQAVLAVKEIGLHFGAVDVIWNEYRKKAYVLEINTAPGLEGSTVKNYSKALEKVARVAYDELDQAALPRATISTRSFTNPIQF